MSEQNNDLAAILGGENNPIIFMGDEVNISALKIGQIPPFTREISKLGGVIESALEGKFSSETIFAAIGEHGEDLIEATSIASGIPVAKIQQANPDEFLELVLKVISVNRDFFVRTLAPKMQALALQVRNGAGLTPSKP